MTNHIFKKNRTPLIFTSIVLFLMMVCLQQGWALPTDHTRPTTIQADTAHINHLTGITIFIGHVKVIQGSP